MAGRKKKLTEKLFDKLLNLIADGLTIREVFSRDDVDFTWQSFRNYLIKDDVLITKVAISIFVKPNERTF